MSNFKMQVSNLWKDFCDSDIRFFYTPTAGWYKVKSGDRIYVEGNWVLIQCAYDFKWIIDEDQSYCERETIYVWGKIFEENLSQTNNTPYYTKYYNMILRSYKGTATDPPVDLSKPYPANRQNISISYRIDGSPNLDNVFNVSLNNEQSKIFAAPNTSSGNPFYPKQITEFNNPVLQYQYMLFTGQSRGDWMLLQTIANAGFTGFRINPILKKVTNDSNEYPLDLNNQLTSLTGLPQDTMLNPIGSSTQRVIDSSCDDSVNLFFSAAKTEEFSKDCDINENTSPIVYSLPEGSYSSIIDQADADGKALNDVNTNGPVVAEENGECIAIPIYSNVQKSGVATRNNCGDGYTGEEVTYIVPAGVYTSIISQQYVDDLAQANVDANKQTYANNNGTCTLVSYTSKWIVDETANYCETTTNPPITTPCGNQTSYNGAEAFPSEQLIQLGSGIGNVVLHFDALSVPDKFIVEFDGVEVINTGYRGDSSQQNNLNNALAAKGLPPETILGIGQGTASFNKTTTTATAKVKVYAPIAGTAWSFTMDCPT